MKFVVRGTTQNEYRIAILNVECEAMATAVNEWERKFPAWAREGMFEIHITEANEGRCAWYGDGHTFLLENGDDITHMLD